MRGGEKMARKAEDETRVYLKQYNKSIDKCLSCPFADCIGEENCGRISDPKDYILKRIFTSRKGEVRERYVTQVSTEVVGSTDNVFKARRYTENEAISARRRALGIVSLQTKIEILRRDDEIERISKEKRKTYRGKPRLLVDANGNWLGRKHAIGKN